jgi:hypothetical protein
MTPSKHWWFSGKIGRCHMKSSGPRMIRPAPGSIPGRCIFARWEQHGYFCRTLRMLGWWMESIPEIRSWNSERSARCPVNAAPEMSSALERENSLARPCSMSIFCESVNISRTRPSDSATTATPKTIVRCLESWCGIWSWIVDLCLEKG